MKYKISLSTYSLDIIEVFTVLGNRKSQFTEQALLNFIGSQKGKDTLKLLLEKEKTMCGHSKDKTVTSRQEIHHEEERSEKISLDGFLE